MERKILYTEYDKRYFHNTLATPDVIRNGDFTFTDLELGVAIARAIIGSSLSSDTVSIIEIKASYYTLLSLLELDDENFILNNHTIGRLRDFSKTSRIGEVAQGINFLFAQKVLNYKIVVDYKLFLSWMGIPLLRRRRTPDYILAKDLFGGVSLMESKGTLNHNFDKITDKIIDGLEQCSSGTRFINTVPGWRVNRSYAACIAFANEGSVDRTKIHFTDPDDKSLPDGNIIRVIRLHYASWFLLAGDIKSALQLADNKPADIITQDKIFKNTLQGEKVFVRISPKHLRFYYFLQFFISEEIIGVINGTSSTFSNLAFELENKSIQNPISNETDILFRDGILIQEKKRMLSGKWLKRG